MHASRRIFGIGRTTRKFVNGIRAGKDWVAASQPSAGNGGLMRFWGQPYPTTTPQRSGRRWVLLRCSQISSP